MPKLRPLLVLLAALALAAPGGQAAAQTVTGPTTVGRGSGLKVYLLTMGPGTEVWERFGHDALWVHDPEHGTDWVYNYGMFDFHSPGYWGRFVKGDWIYQIGVEDIAQTMQEYTYLNRTVTAQALNLTAAQALELQSYLNWNMLPGNREYLYNYYTDNCSTRVRDALDMVLGGRIRAATDTVPAGTSFRWQSRRFLAAEPVVYSFLEAGLGPPADRPISQWEEMFLPEKVAARVAEVRVPDARGRLVPLVSSTRVLYQAVGREPIPAAPPRWIPRYLILGAAVGAVLVLLGVGAERRRFAPRFGFSLTAVLWSALAGVGGLLLIGLWAFTNHTIAYRNENLFQLSPLALPLVVLLPALAFGGRWAARPARVFALLVAFSSLLGLVLQALPWFRQVNGEIIALALPINLALAWATLRLARSQNTAYRSQKNGVAPASILTPDS
ncbi:MAG TPA: DUF4105 domain-containing protein [Longimicrobiaceae bacterium]|nr:DUF4105 domain-containing protein [Longimicrobiaceae bacterium]